MMLNLICHPDAEAFMGAARAELETQEAKNTLILGICGQLINEPGCYKNAPILNTIHDENGLVLAALMTPPHKLVICMHQGDFISAARLLVEGLITEGWQIPGVLGPSQDASRFVNLWTRVAGCQALLERRSHLYKLQEVKTPVAERGRLVVGKPADLDLVTRWMYEFQIATHGESNLETAGESSRERLARGDIFLWEDGSPVSMAMKTRPTRSGISVGLVYTPEDLRGNGYATACVGELNRKLFKEGWEHCALFADVDNASAIHAYTTIGYQPIREFHEYKFECNCSA